MSWFDDPKNTTGALTTRLANDAAQVKGVCTSFLLMFVLLPILNLSVKQVSGYRCKSTALRKYLASDLQMYHMLYSKRVGYLNIINYIANLQAFFYHCCAIHAINKMHVEEFIRFSVHLIRNCNFL